MIRGGEGKYTSKVPRTSGICFYFLRWHEDGTTRHLMGKPCLQAAPSMNESKKVERIQKVEAVVAKTTIVGR